jgi:hypothetical protein
MFKQSSNYNSSGSVEDANIRQQPKPLIALTKLEFHHIQIKREYIMRKKLALAVRFNLLSSRLLPPLAILCCLGVALRTPPAIAQRPTQIPECSDLRDACLVRQGSNPLSCTNTTDSEVDNVLADCSTRGSAPPSSEDFKRACSSSSPPPPEGRAQCTYVVLNATATVTEQCFCSELRAP